jgi:molybdopterin converting factor small subunit
MTVSVLFHSYFKDLAGSARTRESLPDGTTLGELHDRLMARFPKLAAMRNSTLLAVGLEYQPRNHVLREGDEVSLFPPVQGG